MNKRRFILMSLALMVIFSGFFIGAAYVNGGEVAESPDVQWVSHTEYWSGDEASTIVRLTNYRGQAFDVDSCAVTILYPDKSVFIDNQPMSESAIPGNWYRTDTIPYVQGTYEQEVVCVYGAGQEIKTSQSFHVNPALTQIQNVSADILSQTALINDVDGNITAQIEGTNESINVNVDTTRTTITDLVDQVNTNISNQLTAQGLDTNSKLTNVNTTLSAQVSETELNLQTQISDVNTSLSQLMTTLNSDLNAQLMARLDSVDSAVADVYTDTQWLVSNAMNQDDAAEITARFDTVDSNLATIEAFCGDSLTNTSDLCVEIRALRDVVDAMRNEQTTYFNTLDQTTTSTWDLLSGDINNNINTLLTDVGVIRSQTTEINSTLSEIRQEQVETVHIESLT